MSSKKRKKSYNPSKSIRLQRQRELKQLVHSAQNCIDIATQTLLDVTQKYKDGTYKSVFPRERLQIIEDYIITLNNDTESMSIKLKQMTEHANKEVNKIVSPEDALAADIEISQAFQDYVIDYQTGVAPTVLDLCKYMEQLDDELPKPKGD